MQSESSMRLLTFGGSVSCEQRSFHFKFLPARGVVLSLARAAWDKETQVQRTQPQSTVNVSGETIVPIGMKVNCFWEAINGRPTNLELEGGRSYDVIRCACE